MKPHPTTPKKLTIRPGDAFKDTAQPGVQNWQIPQHVVQAQLFTSS
jgi:hypothetical protein